MACNPAVGFADQGTQRGLAFAKVEQAVADAAVSHFVIEPGDRDAVVRADTAVVIDPVFRHRKQGDTLYPAGSIGQAGQNEMHDIAGGIVIATANPHLVARDRTGSVLVLLRAGAQITQRRTHVRLRQAHGAEELAIQHRLHQQSLLWFGTVSSQQVGRRARQHHKRVRARITRLEHAVAAWALLTATGNCIPPRARSPHARRKNPRP